jgi:hypothetical protein
MRLAALAIVLVLTACAEESPPPAEGSQDLLLQYAQCMRDNGVQLPDPVDGQPGSMYEGVDQESPAFQQADEVCSPILQGTVEERKQQNSEDAEQQQDEMLSLAQCLRDHGIDVPDPVPGAETPFGDSLDRTDPATAKALEECTR